MVLPRDPSELQVLAVADFRSIMKQATGGDLMIAFNKEINVDDM